MRKGCMNMLVNKKIDLAKVMEKENGLSKLNEFMDDTFSFARGSREVLALRITNEYGERFAATFPDCEVEFVPAENYKGLTLNVFDEDDERGALCLDCYFYVGRGVMAIRYDPDSDTDKWIHLTFSKVSYSKDLLE